MTTNDSQNATGSVPASVGRLPFIPAETILEALRDENMTLKFEAAHKVEHLSRIVSFLLNHGPRRVGVLSIINHSLIIQHDNDRDRWEKIMEIKQWLIDKNISHYLDFDAHRTSVTVWFADQESAALCKIKWGEEL